MSAIHHSSSVISVYVCVLPTHCCCSICSPPSSLGARRCCSRSGRPSEVRLLFPWGSGDRTRLVRVREVGGHGQGLIIFLHVIITDPAHEGAFGVRETVSSGLSVFLGCHVLLVNKLQMFCYFVMLGTFLFLLCQISSYNRIIHTTKYYIIFIIAHYYLLI